MAEHYKSQICERVPIGAIKHKPNDSPVWTDLLKIRHLYLRNRTVKVNNGQSVLFWEEAWLKDKFLCILHPVLYDICDDKYVSVHTVLLSGAQLNFSRWLPTIMFDSWLTIINEVFSYS